MRILVLCLSIVLAALPVRGAELSAIDRCASFAAYIWEPGFRETGIGWDMIDVDAALPACSAAHLEAPDDPPTLYRLGRIHLQLKDYDTAMPLLLRSAEAGYASAQTAYGTAYMRGDTGQPDHLLAYLWLKRAAANGNPVAKGNLGIMYLGRHSIPRDPEVYRALQFEAAWAGVDAAQNNVAWMYEHGYLVKQDLIQAQGWYRLAVVQGHVTAMSNLGQLLAWQGDGQADHDEAFALLNKAAELGDAGAATAVGHMHANGIGTPVDFDLARAAFERGYRRGDAAGAYHLGEMYEYGTGVPADRTQAFPYYLQAGWMGHAGAQARVGFFVSSGLGGAPNDDAAGLAWFVRAAEQGNVFAQVSAAEIYGYVFNGEASPLFDGERSRYWYEAAARSGSLKAALRVAVIHAGDGDFDRAQAYIAHVLESGDEEMIEEAHHTIEVLGMIKQGTLLPV